MRELEEILSMSNDPYVRAAAEKGLRRLDLIVQDADNFSEWLDQRLQEEEFE